MGDTSYSYLIVCHTVPAEGEERHVDFDQFVLSIVSIDSHARRLFTTSLSFSSIIASCS